MKKVLVFYGGMSREHDISMMTGRAVAASLADAGWTPVPVVISRDGLFSFPGDDACQSAGPWYRFDQAVPMIAAIKPACVFIGLHGTFGEDGRIQSLCDLLDLPYVGSDSIGSAIGIDKWATKAVFLAAGIPTSPARMLQGADLEDPALVEAACLEIGFPMVLKATREGSSFGVAIVRDSQGFQSALAAVRTCSDMILFEKFQKGREFSVPVIEDPLTGLPRALPVIEIVVHKAEFFDYSTKYDPKAADEICPAPIEPDLAGRMSAAAIKAHRALMLSGYSRTDFIATADGCVWALETNTLPGMTAFSLLPKSAAVAGITYPELLDALIRRALARHAADSRQ